MNKQTRLKTIQLILYLILGVITFALIFTNTDLFHQVATDPATKTLCIILWILFVLAFVWIFVDFSIAARYKRDYNELNYIIYTDPVSGLANRNSCDIYIGKYIGKDLPDGFCCIMFDLMNLTIINKQRGHEAGNEMIKDFSNILNSSIYQFSDYFLGRNSGNQFLAFFENTYTEEILACLDEIEKKVTAHNTNESDKPIEFRFGVCTNTNGSCKSITELISRAAKRTS